MREVKVVWKPKSKQPTGGQPSTDLFCQERGVPLVIDTTTGNRIATFAVNDAEDGLDLSRFLELLLDRKSATVVLPTGEVPFRGLDTRTFLYMVICWLSNTGRSDYCSSVLCHEYTPSHEKSHCPCKQLRRVCDFAADDPSRENRLTLGSSGAFVMDLGPDAFASWCAKYGRETAPGKWRLDNQPPD